MQTAAAVGPSEDNDYSVFSKVLSPPKLEIKTGSDFTPCRRTNLTSDWQASRSSFTFASVDCTSSCGSISYLSEKRSVPLTMGVESASFAEESPGEDFKGKGFDLPSLEQISADLNSKDVSIILKMSHLFSLREWGGQEATELLIQALRDKTTIDSVLFRFVDASFNVCSFAASQPVALPRGMNSVSEHIQFPSLPLHISRCLSH